MRRLLTWMDSGSGRPGYVPVWYWRIHQLGFVAVAFGALVPFWITSEPYGSYGCLVYIAFPLGFYAASYGVMRRSWSPPARHGAGDGQHDEGQEPVPCGGAC